MYFEMKFVTFLFFQMYEKDVRTQLFLWKMEKVLIFAMADPVFHGTERVVQNMQEIDPYS